MDEIEEIVYRRIGVKSTAYELFHENADKFFHSLCEKHDAYWQMHMNSTPRDTALTLRWLKKHEDDEIIKILHRRSHRLVAWHLAERMEIPHKGDRINPPKPYCGCMSAWLANCSLLRNDRVLLPYLKRISLRQP